MEGDGPGRSGLPRQLGLLMASADAVSLDAAVCAMFGLAADDLLTTRLARRTGLAAGAPTIDGELPFVTDMRLPATAPLVFGPRRLQGFARRHLVQRPVCDAALCKLCGECWRLCPAQAIGRAGRGLNFDYDRCIRCYCCVEVCPHGALAAREPPVGRVLRRFLR
jgi:Pyruvate/2-oxoacid:ferredoxin oxidoreductase delta subunit